METTIKLLDTLSKGIQFNEANRVELKKNLYGYKAGKAFTEKMVEARVLLAETPVYLYDIEKKYGNDKARVIGVKSILSEDQVYLDAVQKIDYLDREIFDAEIALRENRIEFNYLVRQYEINTLVLKGV